MEGQPADSVVDYPGSTEIRKLRRWFRVYLAIFVLGIASLFLQTSDLMAYVAQALLGASIVVHITCMVFAYRVQGSLVAARLARTAPWAIVVADWLLLWWPASSLATNGAWLMFWLLCVVVPLTVLINANRITRRLQQGTLAMPVSSGA